MQRTNDLLSQTAPCRDTVVVAARSGVLEYSELAFWWCLRYWEAKSDWPKVDAIAPGVWQDFGQRINRSAAYRGLCRARRTQGTGVQESVSADGTTGAKKAHKPL